MEKTFIWEKSITFSFRCLLHICLFCEIRTVCSRELNLKRFYFGKTLRGANSNYLWMCSFEFPQNFKGIQPSLFLLVLWEAGKSLNIRVNIRVHQYFSTTENCVVVWGRDFYNIKHTQKRFISQGEKWKEKRLLNLLKTGLPFVPLICQ